MAPDIISELVTLTRERTAVWELLHDNSKTSRYVRTTPSDESVLDEMAQLWPSLPYTRFPKVSLEGRAVTLEMSLGEALAARASARTLAPGTLSLDQLATLLHAAYGVTRDERAAGYPRAFRTVPSGGALYPLEIYVLARTVDELAPGLYHYDPTQVELHVVHAGDHTEAVAPMLVQPDLVERCAALLFITATFERTTFKYGARGYRFVLMESGHVGQNLDLAAAAMGLGALNVGGFFDRDVDRWLELDGVERSAIYLTAIGAGDGGEDGAGLLEH